MFPNSPNTPLLLLKVAPRTDSVGNRCFSIVSSKEVVGTTQSITINEHKLSVEMKKVFSLKIKIQSFLYDNEMYTKVDNVFYKIERTYIQGQFIELYLSKTDEVILDGN